jgi:anti-sigma regulatory factor (Ser/Thr protein kinase)
VQEISLHILDLLENGVEAGASRIDLRIEEDLEADRMVIEIDDNGCGMSQAAIDKALDPFYTTRKTRHVGLGLPLFSEAAQRCDGNLAIQSEPGKGTRVKAVFRHGHIDRAPLGDLPSALLAVLLSERPVDLSYCHRVNGKEFQFDSSDARKELGDIPLTHPKVRDWLIRVLREGEASLSGERKGQAALPAKERDKQG